LLKGAVLTVGVFVAVGLFAAVGFQTFFTLFHRVFFEGDTWLFNYTDSLIQFYPLPFWFATSIALVSVTIGEAVIIGWVGWRWGR
jgi:integral membrane protein (TIGR01906 family)